MGAKSGIASEICAISGKNRQCLLKTILKPVQNESWYHCTTHRALRVFHANRKHNVVKGTSRPVAVPQSIT